MFRSIVYLIKFILGIIFIVSGFVKAVDPIGFSYKLDEYFTVFQMESFSSFSLSLSVVFCFFEMLIGITLLFHIFLRATLIFYFILLTVFGFLTFYSAYFNVVKDCGCFGDFIKFKPWESFFKDLILLAFSVFIFINRRLFVPQKKHRITAVVIVVFSLWYIYFTFYTLNHLPIIDFRAYKEGNNIVKLMSIPEGAEGDVYAVHYTLKNPETGETVQVDDKTFSDTETYWTWEVLKTSEPVLISEGYKPLIHDFALLKMNENSTEDVTNIVLESQIPVLFLVVTDVSSANKKALQEVFSLVQTLNPKSVSPVMITAAGNKELQELGSVPTVLNVLKADKITLKTIIRSNPGLVLYKSEVVLKKWHYNDMPTKEDIQKILKKH